jgi:hypothetical protein
VPKGTCNPFKLAIGQRASGAGSAELQQMKQEAKVLLQLGNWPRWGTPARSNTASRLGA